MAPTLLPGDYLLTARSRLRAGDVVVFEHPAIKGFHLVKRVHDVAPDGVFVVSDAPDPTTVDSRTFGTVPAAGMYRVVFRYWPIRRMGRVGSR